MYTMLKVPPRVWRMRFNNLFVIMFTQEQIENAFNLLKDRKTKEGKLTWQQNCIIYMLDYPHVCWHWSWEFCSKRLSNWEWLSHKWQARVSDLAIQHPELVEVRKVGRFHCYRLREENMEQIDKFIIF